MSPTPSSAHCLSLCIFMWRSATLTRHYAWRFGFCVHKLCQQHSTTTFHTCARGTFALLHSSPKGPFTHTCWRHVSFTLKGVTLCLAKLRGRLHGAWIAWIRKEILSDRPLVYTNLQPFESGLQSGPADPCSPCKLRIRTLSNPMT